MATLSGCIQLRQESLIKGPDHPDVLLCDDKYVLVGINMKREQIIVDKSHIIGPNGKRYSIQVEPHQFDVEQKYEAIRAAIYPCGDDGSRIRRWMNGIWTFHFAVKEGGIDRVIEQQWEYRTFYYNPIIHGPPN